jgi:hypothetical protein
MVPSSLAFLPACKGLAEMWMLRNKFGQGKFLLDRSRAVPRTLPCIHLTCVYTLLLQKPCTGPLSRVRFLGEHHGPTPPPPPKTSMFAVLICNYTCPQICLARASLSAFPLLPPQSPEQPSWPSYHFTTSAKHPCYFQVGASYKFTGNI